MTKKIVKSAESTRRGKIMLTAARLFIEQGYENTGMRQIAEEAGVSLSLANYHFGSKREIGKKLILWHLRAVQPHVYEVTSHDERLFSSTLLRVNYVLMNQPHLRRFYEDTLLNDIYLEAVTGGNVEKEKQRSLTTQQMLWVLSDSYIPASIERAMVTCPFADMLGMDVPEYIMRHSAYNLSETGTSKQHSTDWYVEKNKELTKSILENNPHLYHIFEDIPQNVDMFV